MLTRLADRECTPTEHLTMVREARLEKTEAGLTPVGGGWFVLNRA
jgi:hypothetical protein